MTTKRWKRHTPEQVVRKLRDADAMLNAGQDLAVGVDQLEARLLQTISKFFAVGRLVVHQRQTLPRQIDHHAVQQRLDQVRLRVDPPARCPPPAACGWHLSAPSAWCRRPCVHGRPPRPLFAGANMPSANKYRQSSHGRSLAICSSRPQMLATGRPRSSPAASANTWHKRENLLGNLSTARPERSTHRMPSKHGRGGIGGRPPAGDRSAGANRSAISSHCVSLSCVRS